MKQKRTVLVIGLDGASWRFLEKWMKSGELPNLRQIEKGGVKTTLISTLPPLTGAAWVSMQTGNHPGRHGIFDFKKRNGELIKATDVKLPRLWEVMNKRGLRAGIINMPVTYPVSPMNGYLVSSFLTPPNASFAYPPSLERKLKKWGYKIDVAGFLPEDKEIDERGLKEIYQAAEKRLKISKKLFQQEPWNLFFVLIKETDVMQHLDFDGPKTKKLYQMIDKYLGEMITQFQEKYPQQELDIVIMSDHGFHPNAKVDVAFYPLLRSVGVLAQEPAWQLKIKRGLRKWGWFKGENKPKITSYGMFVEDKAQIDEIITKLKKVRIEGQRVFATVKAARELYGNNYSAEVPDILWLTQEKFAPNPDPLASQLTYSKKTILKGHHYADRKGVLIIKSGTISRTSFNKRKKVGIEEIGSLICDWLTVPQQTMIPHGFSLKRKRLTVEGKVVKAKKFLKKTLERYQNPAIAWTGGKDSTVLLHLVREITDKKLPVMFIDHQNHFEETLEFVNRLKNEWGLNLIVVGDQETIAAYQREKDLAKRKELARMVKIKAIEKAIEKYKWDGLLVGIRWDEHPARSKERLISPRANHDRIHPLLEFTEEDIWDYVYLYKVPYNPLYDKGYRSVGEKEFTRPVFEKGAEERAGREREKEVIMEKLRKLGYF